MAEGAFSSDEFLCVEVNVAEDAVAEVVSVTEVNRFEKVRLGIIHALGAGEEKGEVFVRAAVFWEALDGSFISGLGFYNSAVLIVEIAESEDESCGDSFGLDFRVSWVFPLFDEGEELFLGFSKSTFAEDICEVSNEACFFLIDLGLDLREEAIATYKARTEFGLYLIHI